MKLTIRMVLYAVFAALASSGIGVFDAETGNFTINIESVVALVSGVVGYLATFGWSRHEKANGGET